MGEKLDNLGIACRMLDMERAAFEQKYLTDAPFHRAVDVIVRLLDAAGIEVETIPGRQGAEPVEEG